MTVVTFYTSKSGNSPIEKFLDKANDGLRAKILRQLRYVQEYGLSAVIPNLRKIRNTPFWELRVLGRDNVRVLYMSQEKNEVLVVHIFKKKKQKTPLKEIAKALKRLS